MCFSGSAWYSDLMSEQENQVEFLSEDLMKTLALIGQHVHFLLMDTHSS